MDIPIEHFLYEVWDFTQSWALLALIGAIPVILVAAVFWVVLPVFGVNWRFRLDWWIIASALFLLAASYVLPLAYRLRSAAQLRRRK